MLDKIAENNAPRSHVSTINLYELTIFKSCISSVFLLLAISCLRFYWTRLLPFCLFILKTKIKLLLRRHLLMLSSKDELTRNALFINICRKSLKARKQTRNNYHTNTPKYWKICAMRASQKPCHLHRFIFSRYTRAQAVLSVEVVHMLQYNIPASKALNVIGERCSKAFTGVKIIRVARTEVTSRLATVAALRRVLPLPARLLAAFHVHYDKIMRTFLVPMQTSGIRLSKGIRGREK